MMKLQDTHLKQLADAGGVSGDEHEVRQMIYDVIKDHVEDARVDAMGNLLAVKKGTGASNLRVLVAAHMDEVGFMVMGIDKSGLLRVRPVGGIDNRILPALRVKVGPKKLPGFFEWRPIHKNRTQTVIKIDEMRIDIGATNKLVSYSKVKPGDRVIFDSETIELSETVLRGKAFDDRAGCAELIELITGDPFPFDLLVAFTVQEEVGLRGATVLGEALKPDAAIILECTACHEVPQDDDEPDMTTVTKMGAGPVLTIKDSRAFTHHGLRQHFVDTAKSNTIPYQFRSAQYAGGTDAGAIHMSNGGIPSLSVSVPGRYLHTPNIVMSMEDFSNTVALVRQSLLHLEPSVLERI